MTLYLQCFTAVLKIIEYKVIIVGHFFLQLPYFAWALFTHILSSLCHSNFSVPLLFIVSVLILLKNPNLEMWFTAHKIYRIFIPAFRFINLWWKVFTEWINLCEKKELLWKLFSEILWRWKLVFKETQIYERKTFWDNSK